MNTNVKWDYGGYSDKYDMDGEIHIGTGIVKVHDIFDPLPEFMKKADVIFCDPPYNKSALSSYYTKAQLPKRGDFTGFVLRWLQCVSLISPKLICLECGKMQTDMWKRGLCEIGYEKFIVFESCYYGNKNNKCDIIIATKSDGTIPEILQNLPFMDEEKFIEYLCKNLEYLCIGDLCMGKGLVGYYSNKYNKPFVGTELNPKRLAVCCERVTTNKRGKIN